MWAASRETWERFWAALLAFKERANILNTATAVLALIDLAEAWLEEQEREQAAR